MNHSSRLRGSLRHTTRETRWLRNARLGMQLYTVALAALAGAIQARPQAAPSVEYQVKAAFLFNFAKFIEWPRDAFPNEKTPINLCVFRHDPFGSALEEVIREKAINNRGLLAERINDLAELKACQLVFVSGREEKQLPEILNSLKGASALVVGESADFAERGGAVQFFLENNKLRFAINVDAIQRARLQASSKLLALARIVHDSGHPKGS
jgi:YfiR/HmsC-like